MANGPSRALIQARVALELLQGKYATLEAQNAELGQTVVDQGVLLEATRKNCEDLQVEKQHLEAEVADQVKRLNELRKARDTAEADARTARELANRTTADNDNLRHELMRLEVEKARLEGHLERVHEFDPVTEQRQYRDGLDKIDRFERHNLGGVMTHDGEGRVGWYLRRAG